MTREEAIETVMVAFDTWESEFDTGNDWSKEHIARDMAIKALKQERCEDAVSRASVFEIMGNLMGIPYDFDRTITEKDVSESMDEIRALPPVTPTRKKGEWVKTGQSFINPNKFLCYSCSECGSDSGKVKTKFCPYCGAEMENEE